MHSDRVFRFFRPLSQFGDQAEFLALAEIRNKISARAEIRHVIGPLVEKKNPTTKQLPLSYQRLIKITCPC